MDKAKQQELLQLWRKTEHLRFYEVVILLTGRLPTKGTPITVTDEECTQERLDLIKRLLIEDIKKFELKIYFWHVYLYGGDEISLTKPKCAKSESDLQYYLYDPWHYADCFWEHGTLSTVELIEWLKNKGIASSFFGTAALKSTPTPILTHNEPEITQKEAAEILLVEVRTIRNWEKGIGTPNDYPGRQSRANFMIFAQNRRMSKTFKREARAVQKALSYEYIEKLSSKKDEEEE